MKLFHFCIFIIFILTKPAYPEMWGYYLKDSLPYEKHQQYWENRFANLTVLCFTGITVSSTDCIIPEFTNEQALFKKAYERSIALIPHVTFTSVKSGIAFLTHPQYWKKIIHTLAYAIRTSGWAGCHFDFEYLPSKYAANFAQFLKIFKAIAPDISLSAAMFPQVEYNPTHAAFHDYALLSTYLDAIVLMCYDQHNPKTKPGPVTGVEWSRKNIEYALQFFKANQLWLGIPAYGYIWKDNTYYSVITMKSLSRYVTRYRNYRHTSGTIVIEYTQNNDHFIAYVPDVNLHNQLYELATSYKLKGIALWRLGFE
ncbi:MAG TPA: glycosyl hydrolase family 18 protein [Spirochaetota bacterium]|nr:glycosyl hydrolase family 18 protein [Spirochaetota bacterium]HOM11072.1 glycosyl hydrolase family 18 protein [Spirochaetota bacterium]HPP50541.1 glycosyl hydrolase family 18 protein [Spirochaetota bacterium]